MSNYITVEFTSPDSQGKVSQITEPVRNAFLLAAEKWSASISASKPSILVSGSIDSICGPLEGAFSFKNRRIDNLLIVAEVLNLDGERKTLGRASICLLEKSTKLPAVGYIQLDAADVQKMVADNALDRLQRVIMHEIGHCLGIGVLWGVGQKNLIKPSGTGGVVYTGEHGVAQYNSLRSGTDLDSVPVENSGGTGTSGSHWRNSVFGNELMTGFIGGSSQPLSVLTLGSLQDIGYSVDFTKAEPYTIPNAGEFDGAGDDFGEDVPTTEDGTIKTVPGFFPDQPLNNVLAYIGIGILLSMIVLVAVGAAYTKAKARRREHTKTRAKHVEMHERGNNLRENTGHPSTPASGNPFRDPKARSRTASDLTKEHYQGTNPFTQNEDDQVAPV